MFLTLKAIESNKKTKVVLTSRMYLFSFFSFLFFYSFLFLRVPHKNDACSVQCTLTHTHTHIDVGVLTNFTINFMTYENRKVSECAEKQRQVKGIFLSLHPHMNTCIQRKWLPQSNKWNNNTSKQQQKRHQWNIKLNKKLRCVALCTFSFRCGQ